MTENVPKEPIKPEEFKQNLMTCEVKEDENGEKQIRCGINEGLVPKGIKSREEITRYAFKKLFGTSCENVLTDIVYCSAKALPQTTPDNDKYNLIIGSCQEMEPKNLLEARLCSQETVLYSTAMKYLERAENAYMSDSMGSHLWHERNMNCALKLLRVHNETVQTLDKLRRGGKQEVVVQHVDARGSQNAFLTGNNLQAGGGVEEKNG